MKKTLKICGREQTVIFFYNDIQRRGHILKHLLKQKEHWDELVPMLHILRNTLEEIGCNLKDCELGCKNEDDCDGIFRDPIKWYMNVVFGCIDETYEYKPLHTHNLERWKTGKWVESMYFVCSKGIFIHICPLYIIYTAYRPKPGTTSQEFYENAINIVWKKKRRSVEKWCPSYGDWRKEYFKIEGWS